MKKLLIFTLLIAGSTSMFAQDWWTKTKKEAIPPDFNNTTLLVERFKTLKLDDAPRQAFLHPDDTEHPLIKKTNNKLDDYNSEIRAIFKRYAYEYKVVSKASAENPEKYPIADYPYVLKHEVYLRKYQQHGETKHFYTYVFYFHDRVNDKSYPYIYLFDEKRLASLEKLVVQYLNNY